MYKLIKNLLLKLSAHRKSNHFAPRVIITGIGMPSYQLAKELQTQKIAQITAFIDHEPWTNLTVFLGVIVHYPSNLVALIKKHDVDVIVEMVDEISISELILEEVAKTGIRRLTVRTNQTLDEQLAMIKQSLHQL